MSDRSDRSDNGNLAACGLCTPEFLKHMSCHGAAQAQTGAEEGGLLAGKAHGGRRECRTSRTSRTGRTMGTWLRESHVLWNFRSAWHSHSPKKHGPYRSVQIRIPLVCSFGSASASATLRRGKLCAPACPTNHRIFPVVLTGLFECDYCPFQNSKPSVVSAFAFSPKIGRTSRKFT